MATLNIKCLYFTISIPSLLSVLRTGEGKKKNVLKVEVLLLVYLNEFCQYTCYIVLSLKRKKNKVAAEIAVRLEYLQEAEQRLNIKMSKKKKKKRATSSFNVTFRHETG